MNNFISFSDLGNHGRLGNQMFQVAAAACLAKSKNLDLVLPASLIRSCFNIPCVDYNHEHSQHKKYEWIEKSYSHDSSFNHVSPNTNIKGYFQSWKYITNEIYVRQLFDFLPQSKDGAYDRLKNKKTIGIHVRRGDYLTNLNTHPLPGIEYLKNAIDVIKKKDGDIHQIIIVTDDKPWCENNFKDVEIFSSDPIDDMCTMSMCDHHIIANSSFSWWAAWLGKKKGQIVVAPRQWFGPQGPTFIESDLFPISWILL
jgi:hypothetical protein